jgi:hypothetical protein
VVIVRERSVTSRPCSRTRDGLYGLEDEPGDHVGPLDQGEVTGVGDRRQLDARTGLEDAALLVCEMDVVVLAEDDGGPGPGLTQALGHRTAPVEVVEISNGE